MPTCPTDGLSARLLVCLVNRPTRPFVPNLLINIHKLFLCVFAALFILPAAIFCGSANGFIINSSKNEMYSEERESEGEIERAGHRASDTYNKLI